MEEVDNIIIHSLRQIGCDIEESIINLKGFDTELTIKATVKCLDIIKPSLGLSTTLPANMAARFRLGAALAQACVELGYRGDIGYQTFLYSSEADLRRVFMFLIEKLPKESDKTLNEPISEISILEKSINSVITQGLSAPWLLPYYCSKRSFRYKGRTNLPYNPINLETPELDKTEEYQDYYSNYQKPVPNQLKNSSRFLSSIISHNAQSIQSGSTDISIDIEWLNSQSSENPTPHRVKLNVLDMFSPNTGGKGVKDCQTKSDDATSIPIIEKLIINEDKKEDLEIEAIQTECEHLKICANDLQSNIKKLNAKLTQATTNYQIEQKKLQHCENEVHIKKKIYHLLPNGEENIKKLENSIEFSTNKLINLANQWEKHRVPLIQNYRDERAKHTTKASASQKKLDEIKLLKEKNKELLEECRNKDQQYSQMIAEVQKLPKEVNRSAYTQRILEIINNVKKQRDEIDKVLADTREIQKEINTLTGRLERSFTVVDELIFRDAKTNEASKKAYKLLATLHSDCNELVNLVAETGSTVREIRDLEEQIDTESAKNVEANLTRITADLKQMKQETAALMVQLQSKGS